MPSELQRLARAVLARTQAKKRDSAWDSRGTVAGRVSRGVKVTGTPKTHINQADNPTVPLSQVLRDGTPGQSANSGTPPGTVVGQYDHVATDHAAMMAQAEYDANPYASALAALRARCPAYVPVDRWHQAIADVTTFISQWGTQAREHAWTVPELFGLHPVPERPAANCSRLSRVDALGLIWLLRGRPVTALTATEAAMRCHSGATLTYRKQNKSVRGSDNLDDMELAS
jgi:hypothetical protein